MNTLSALKLRDGEGNPTGKWHFCSSNSRTGTYPLGYCADHGGHDSPDEAQACFRRYLLDDISEVSYSAWTGCEVCDEPTKKGLTTRRPYGHGYALCDEHRNHKQVERLEPEVGTIWGSY